MTSADLPRSIEVWTCPECGHRSLTIGGRGHLTGCSRWPAGLGVINRYVPVEATDEMVEHIATLIAERFGGWDIEHDRWENDATRAREMDWARALVAEVVGFSTSDRSQEGS